MAFAVMGFPRRADPHTDHVDDLLDQRARIPGRVDGQQRAHQLHQIGAGERGLVDARDHARQARAVQQQARRAAPRGARVKVRGAVKFQTARIRAPLGGEFGPRGGFRLGRAGGFLRGRELLGGRLTVDDDQVVGCPFPQPGGALRPRLEAFFGDAGDLGHPGMPIDDCPFGADGGMQLMAHHRLIDHPGGFGFVVQRLGVNRHQRAVGAGLPVGHDDMGVQVRIPAPRRLVLIGDPHQPRQPLQILIPGHRVMHPGVAGVLVQIGHRRVDRPSDAPRPSPFPRYRQSGPAAATHSSARRTSSQNRAPTPR